jgi:hypothetical protein
VDCAQTTVQVRNENRKPKKMRFTSHLHFDTNANLIIPLQEMLLPAVLEPKFEDNSFLIMEFVNEIVLGE